MTRFDSALLLLSLLPGAVSHAGFWFFRMGCDAVPTPSKNVMGNEPNVMTVSNELKILGTRKGFYKPGETLDVRLLTENYDEHLLHITGGVMQNDETLDEDDQASVKCDGKLAAFGIPNTKRRIYWTAPQSGVVNVTMLAADAYGPVDFYQLTLKPSKHDL